MLRSEYPRPQYVRENWINLNGEWEFEFDDAREGLSKHWELGTAFNRRIQVPFCFESKLSGIGDTAAHDVVWYRRSFELTDSFIGKRVYLHFGAVDYDAKVWINGILVAEHSGGHTPFKADITEALRSEGNIVVVRAEDYSRDMSLPRGKLYCKDQSETIFYTRTTGIWQTVWLEPVSEIHIDHVKLTPDIDHNTVELIAYVNGWRKEWMNQEIELKVEVFFGDEAVTTETYVLHHSIDKHLIALPDYSYHDSRWTRWWTPENPHLYDLKLTLSSSGGHHPYKMKLILDQGYFPEGLLTAPSDDALRQDVELTKQMGFNGARKHQKLEDPRYLYWCDKLGLLVWGEAANSYEMHDTYIRRFTSEWQETIVRDYNHPSIIAWVPLNESWGVPNIMHNVSEQRHAMAMYYLVKSLDPTRLVISNDGWEHMKTDLLTIHDYEWREDVLAERYSTVESVLNSRPAARQLLVGGTSYQQEPILVTEFGGISFKKSEWSGWGYSGADNEEDYLNKLIAVVRPLLDSPVIQGICYTQLTDVEQEINGLLTYDRVPKVPLDKIRDIMEGKWSQI